MPLNLRNPSTGKKNDTETSLTVPGYIEFTFSPLLLLYNGDGLGFIAFAHVLRCTRFLLPPQHSGGECNITVGAPSIKKCLIIN